MNLTFCPDGLLLWSMWNSTNPNIPYCFQYSVFLPICLLFTLYFFFFILRNLIKYGKEYKSKLLLYPKTLLICQLSFHGILMVLAATDLIMYHLQSVHTDDMVYITNAALLITIIFSLLNMLIHYHWSRPVPIAPFVLWFSMSLVSIPRLYQRVHLVIQQGVSKHDLTDSLWLSLAWQVICFILLILSSLSAKPNPNSEYANLNISPEYMASPFSRLIFIWLFKPLVRSYREELKEETMYHLNEDNQVEKNYLIFKTLWDKEKQRHPIEFSRPLPVNKPSDHHNSYANTNNNQPYLINLSLTNDDDRSPLIINEQQPAGGGGAEQVPEVAFRDGHQEENKKSSSSENSLPELIAGPSLFKVLVLMFGTPFLIIWMWKFAYDLLIFSNPMLLKLFLTFMDDYTEPKWHGWIYAAGFFFCTSTSSLLFQHCTFIAIKQSLRMRSTLIAAIFNKALTLANQARQRSTVGEIVNLMSVDAERVSSVCLYIIYFWSVFFQMFLAMYLLWNELSYSVFVGVGSLVFFMIINGTLIKRLQVYENSEMTWKDSRIKMLYELLNGMKFIKLYAWELSFQDRVSLLRNKELSFLMKTYLVWSAVSIIWDFAPFLVLLATFMSYIYTGNGIDHVLTPQRAFVSLTLLNMIRFPMTLLPGQISIYVNAWVSVKRLNRYFCEEDIDLSTYECYRQPARKDTNAIELDNATFTWSSEMAPILKNITMEVKQGGLVAIVGKVGLGKSSLLSSILGEMKKISGNVIVKGRTAYVPQEAWLQNVSLKDNIIFGHEFDEARYQSVISACALLPDLALLPAGDATEIGERGINLSGGQKQRICLARAVYADADIYLLDDPVSSVDANVAQHLFDQVIGPNGLLANKTRVFCTHSVHWLSQMDCIFVINKQHQIGERGSFKELLANGRDFSKFLKEHHHHQQPHKGKRKESSTSKRSPTPTAAGPVIVEETTTEENENGGLAIPQSVSSHNSRPASRSLREFAVGSLEECHDSTGRPPRIQRLNSVSITDFSEPTEPIVNDGGALESQITHRRHRASLSSQSSQDSQTRSIIIEETITPSIAPVAPPTGPAASHRLTEDETTESGRVSWKAYVSYFLARGILISIVHLFLNIMFKAAEVGSSVWLKELTDDQQLLNLTNSLIGVNQSSSTALDLLSKIRQRIDWFMMIYGFFGIVQLLFCVSYIFVGLYTIYRASYKIHKNLLTRILRAPLTFFDTTPTGRIVNRFSRDIEAVDHQLPSALNDLFGCGIGLGASLFVVSYSTPLFLSVLLPISFLYFLIQMLYVPMSRQSRRLDSITRSPIFTHFTETVNGAAIIRAFGEENRFENNCHSLVNNNARYYYIKWASNRWLSFYLDLFSATIVFSSAAFALLQRGDAAAHSVISAGLVGLSISYALQVTDNLSWLVRQIAELETDAVSLERIEEYSNVIQEPAWNIPQVDNANHLKSWPEKGEIKITNFNLRYREHLPLVLNQLNAHILPGERIGVVGRTGAGKSSLTLALFRLIEGDGGEADDDGGAGAGGGGIEIDNENIQRLGLHLLRSRITILPQDPILFSGTLRSNLDPFERHSDEELWQALQCSHLLDWVKQQPMGLLHECGEGGTNLSAGQRQLLCLARAILRKSKILILDEATAAVDLDTDKLLMATVKQYFDKATIIIIAHRLATIMDAQRVLVMDQGTVVEFDTPSNLMANTKSAFYQLAHQAGMS